MGGPKIRMGKKPARKRKTLRGALLKLIRGHLGKRDVRKKIKELHEEMLNGIVPSEKKKGEISTLHRSR